MTRRFSFGGVAAGDGRPVLIVAETGINHNGSVETASKMVGEAARAGAGAVKFQTFSADEFMSSPDQTYTYTSNGKRVTESMTAMFKRCEIPPGSFGGLFDLARKSGLEPFSTPTDLQSAKRLLPFGLRAIKVGSDDLINLPLLEDLASLGLPMILSTGMADLDEIARGREKALSSGAPSVALMVCTSLYPTPPGRENLGRITTLRSHFPDTVIGFSDHTLGISAARLAVALGAAIVEKHFTLDRTMEGPDHWFSSDPAELRDLVREIRAAEASIGSGSVVPEPEELEMRSIARRSVAAARTIAAGAAITRDDLCCKRPGTGIEPRFLDSLAGKHARRAIQASALLDPEDLVESIGVAPGAEVLPPTPDDPSSGPGDQFETCGDQSPRKFCPPARLSMTPNQASRAAFESAIDKSEPEPEGPIPHNRPHFTALDAEALREVLADGWVATGPRAAAFEKTLADALDPAGSSEAVMVSNGTAALYLALRGAGIGPGHEVIVPNFSCTAISNAVRMAGATPVPADSDPGNFNLSPRGAAAVVSRQTRGFVAPGIFGVPARVNAIAAALAEASGRPVCLHGDPFPPPHDSIVAIEDCAQCLGAFHGGGAPGPAGWPISGPPKVAGPPEITGPPAGTIGWCSIFSFHATKPVTGGTGGALFSARNSIAAWARDFIDYDMPADGRGRFNFLPGDLAPALAASQFSRFDLLLGARRFASETYETVRARHGWTAAQTCPSGARPNHFRFVVLLPDRQARDLAISLFADRGVCTIGPILREELIACHLGVSGNFPVSIDLADRALSLPVFPGLGPERVYRVASALDEVLTEIARRAGL